MGNNQEWIGLMGKRISTHYGIMFVGFVFLGVFGAIAYVFGMNLYNSIKEYVGETNKRKSASSPPATAVANQLSDNETYENASPEQIYGASEYERFTKAFEELKTKYEQYNAMAKEIAEKHKKPMTDILDERVMNAQFDNYPKKPTT